MPAKPKFIKTIVVIVAISIIAIGYLFLAKENEQINKNTRNVATENIFCGKNYTVEIFKINDIDVVNRIVEVWEKREGKCDFGFEGENIGIAKKLSTNGKIYNIVLYDKDNKEQNDDPFNQSVEQFEINLGNNTISYQLQLDGSFFEIGKFKEEVTKD